MEVCELADAALRLTEGAAAAGWRGPDPYDGLWWDWPSALVSGPRRRQAITQLHARSPIDVRRLYRRTHPQLAKALALFASTGLRVNTLTADGRGRELAADALARLAADRRAGPYGWGYPFDVQTRWSFSSASEPSIVPTAFAVGALLEGEREEDRAELGDRARAAARWVLDTLWVPEGYFTYHPRSRANIHNANLLGAWLVWTALGEPARDQAVRAVRRTLAGQRPDGSWPYGEGDSSMAWADSFHSGYVLACLDRLSELDPAIEAAVARGAHFYCRFFGPSGEARLWSDRRYPEDAHACGTGLTTLAVLCRRGLAEPELLQRVAERALEHVIDSGHAVFRRYRWGLRTFVPYLRWCDGHVALGMADAALALSGADVR